MQSNVQKLNQVRSKVLADLSIVRDICSKLNFVVYNAALLWLHFLVYDENVSCPDVFPISNTWGMAKNSEMRENTASNK